METKTLVKNPALRVIGWVLLFGLLGGLLSCLAGYGIAWKWFVPWRALPALPEPAKSIAGASVRVVDVETQTGRFLRYDPETGSADWAPVSAPETETDEGCEPFNRARRLDNVIDQQLVCQNYADGGYTAVYALRSDGRVYAWHAGDSAYDALLLFIFPGICAPVGMGIGLVIGLLRNRKKTAAPAQGAL